jgi:hypothetical protein
VEHQIGTDSWNITFGVSKNGFSLNMTLDGHEADTSFRPGGKALGGAVVVVGAFLLPETIPAIIQRIVTSPITVP